MRYNFEKAPLSVHCCMITITSFGAHHHSAAGTPAMPNGYMAERSKASEVRNGYGAPERVKAIGCPPLRLY